MQQHQVQQDEQYADGLGEYASFYGGPAYNNYLAPAKLAASTVQELPASHPIDVQTRHSDVSDLRHSISYDLAANVPAIKKEAEGLQVACQQSNHGIAMTYHTRGPGYTKEAESPRLAYQYSNPEQDKMMDPGYRQPLVGFAKTSAIPTPFSYRQKQYGADPYLHQFPNPPTSPTSPTLPAMQHHVHPAYRTPNYQQQAPAIPLVPQPLRFQRTNSLPPTPPQSIQDDGLRDRMQSLNMGDPSPPPRYPPGTLGRMNTMSSMGSTRSSTTPGSPFEHQNRISVAQSSDLYLPPGDYQGMERENTSSLSQGPLEMNPTEAHAEVRRRLDKADEVSSRKSSGAALKKGFSLRRSNTPKATTSTGSHSQEALASVLEEVAEEGSLPMVKAVISMGADPMYRSTGKMKKVAHEALTKATSGGHARVVDFLLTKGASYGEPQKKALYTPLDRALLTATYKGHAELVGILVSAHGANPLIEQWPREMETAQQYWNEQHLRLSKTSVVDGVSHWKNEEQGLSVLRIITQSPKFDPTAPVAAVFDNKSELQSAEYSHRPWQTTYEYSALACFARAGWTDAVEELLAIKGSPGDYEKEDEVLQYQDKATRYISPVNAMSKDTWDQRPSDALSILQLLINAGFNVNLAQRTPSDLGQRSPLARALSANASQAVELITHNRPELVKEVISFRCKKKETKAQPLAAAIALEKLETARVLLRAGAHPRDPAFDMNALQFCAHQGGETGTAMLAEMLPIAPEFTYAALDTAIHRTNNDCVRVLLDYISLAASRNEIAALPAIWDMLLPLTSDASNQTSYLELINMVCTWDSGHALPRPQLPAILAAIKRDNYLGMERMLQLGVVDGKSLVLNCKARPLGEEGMWTVLECAEGTERSAEWLGLLRRWGAPLFI